MVMIEDLLKKIDDTYTVKKTEEMIAIPSVVGDEAQLAEYLRDELESLGLEVELEYVLDGRPNVYGKLIGSSKGRRLHFNGHTDTVPVVDGWETDPFKPVRKGNRLHGLGSCDMKAGIACTLSMIKAFVDSSHEFSGELSFSGVIDEESHGKGAKALLSTEYGKVDAIVLAEPYPGDESKPIPYGITGKILYDIYVNGVAAHGFRPHLGVNAIEDASRIISSLGRLQFKNHPDFGTGNYCTLKIEGGYKVYSVVIPAKTRFEINRLLVPGETIEYAIADMERLVDSLELESKVDVNVKPPQYEPYVMAKNHELFTTIKPIYKEVMGKPPLYEFAYGITDANIFAGEGDIPCLHLGPARGGAHQKNEYVLLDWLPKITKIYTMLAAKYLS
jgi:acetylornithine deacetylase/succinyl-diaminopimelate desuccinylase-like protein